MTTRPCYRSVAVASFVAALVSAGSARAQTWSAGPSPSTPIVRGAGAWFAPNGRFYVMGGRSADTAGSDLMNPREFDPVGGNWTIKAAVFNDNQVCNMVAAVLNDGGTDVIFTVGGSAAGASTSTTAVRRYDPALDSLTVLASDPWSGAPANTLPGGGAVYNTKLYVFGGFTINTAMTSQIWEFDPAGAAGAKWTLKTGVLPVQVGYVPCATIGSMIYGAGGATWTGTTLADSTSSFAYDPVADVVSAINPTPRATGETRAVVENSQMWVLGGGRTAPNPSNQVDAYSPSPNSWSLAPSFATARRNFAADVDPATGRIFIVGGYTPATPSAAMEIFSGNPPINSYCGAGDPNVTTACPCGPQGATGHGCDNSAATGGSLLTASGTPVPDTLVLTASGELPTSLSIFLQGNSSVGSGIVFGQGVRCAAGTLKRLYAHNAVGGVVSAPVGSDPSVTTQSANLGDPIAPGSTRYYAVYYRDPNVQGSCSALATFSISNGLSVLY
jgi:N-acetylneuraminic acid mutarotase